VQEILAKVSEAKPNSKASAIALPNKPNAAWQVSLGREGQIFVNPYTGEITGEGATGWSISLSFRRFFNWKNTKSV
jgi:uncharacterized iron-regulated membrane protein